MKKSILLLTALALFVAGCKSYPRYRPDAEVNPQETRPDDQYITTSDYMRLGMILQRSLGKPYKGRSKWEEGVDCSKFTRDVFEEFNKTTLPRTAAEQYQEGEEVPRTRLKFGDLVFFRTERDRISHVGIAIGFGEFIHASTSRGVIISKLGEEYWAKRYVGARRVLQKSSN
jgi:cell wall-associated NlpC family hydrolase